MTSGAIVCDDDDDVLSPVSATSLTSDLRRCVSFASTPRFLFALSRSSRRAIGERASSLAVDATSSDDLRVDGAGAVLDSTPPTAAAAADDDDCDRADVDGVAVVAVDEGVVVVEVVAVVAVDVVAVVAAVVTIALVVVVVIDVVAVAVLVAAVVVFALDVVAVVAFVGAADARPSRKRLMNARLFFTAVLTLLPSTAAVVVVVAVVVDVGVVVVVVFAEASSSLDAAP